MADALERRDLMAYTSLGYSLPDLTVRGFAGQAASYGGAITVTVDVDNYGASSITEPFNQTPDAVSSADASATQVAVYLNRGPHTTRGRVLLGFVDVPAVPQKSLERITATLLMPETRPAGFPGVGRDAFVTFEVDPNMNVPDMDRTNNLTRRGVPVLIGPAQAVVDATGLDVPDVLSPGDAILPSVRIENVGTVNTATISPFDVYLVASQDRNFGPGDVILTTWTVENLPGLNGAPTKALVLGDSNLNPLQNSLTLTAPAYVTLPGDPANYFIGVAIDPTNQLGQPGGADSALGQVRRVGPSGLDLPPAGVIGVPQSGAEFPIPPLQTTAMMTTTALATGSLSSTSKAKEAVAAARARFSAAGRLAGAGGMGTRRSTLPRVLWTPSVLRPIELPVEERVTSRPGNPSAVKFLKLG